MRFHWDEAKDESNQRRHGISFEDAAQAFEDPLGGTLLDALHSDYEDRFVVIGAMATGKLVAVTYAVVDDGDARIISARAATRFERRRYMNEKYEIREEPDEDMGDIDTRHLDWSKMKRGAVTLSRGPATVTLDDDVRVVFFGDKEVNDALRLMIKQGNIPHFKKFIEAAASREKNRGK
jgi:uncharacterized DUF497 family protein